MPRLSPEAIVTALDAIERDLESGRSLDWCLRDRGIRESLYRRWLLDHGGQRFDRITGELQPWLTHLALDEIQQWELADKTVLEWGGGSSTLWWATHCRRVFTIEADPRWCDWIRAQAIARGIANVALVHRPIGDAGFSNPPSGCRPDIVVIDGPRRLSCLKRALTLPPPLTIIFDNWRGQGVHVDAEAARLMKRHIGVSYPQIVAGQERNPWQTAIWHLI